MTALPVPAGPRQWTLALATALLLHAGLLVTFHHLVHGGAADVGLRGIAVGLPPAGAAPGAPAEATVGEAAAVAPPEAAEVTPAPVPEVAEAPLVETPMVETAAVRPPEAFVPPTAEPLYGPVETVEPVDPPEEQEVVEAAPPVEAELQEVEPVEVAEAAEAEPQEEVVAETAMAVPPPPKAKPQPPVTEPQPAEPQPAEPPVAAEVAPAVEPAQTQTQTAALPQDGPAGAKDELVGNRGNIGAGTGMGTGESEGQSGGGAPGAFVDYKAQLYAWLEKHKEYPRRARLRRQEGTALLEFVMDRGGRVLSYRIVESSGYTLLDNEVVAMIERASPLPTPPAAMEGERFNYRIPVLFDQR